MAKSEIKINMQEVNKNITVKVYFKKSKWYDIRFFVGTNLVKLGARVAGFGYKVSKEND